MFTRLSTDAMDQRIIEYPYIYNNERDIEVPIVLSFIKEERNLNPGLSVLDVGYVGTWQYYAPGTRYLIYDNIYDGMDILLDHKTSMFLSNTYTDNFVTSTLNKYYDTVLCISTIEHAGMTTYNAPNYLDEQLALFTKILNIAQKSALLTFPFGKEAVIPNQLATITELQLEKFNNIATTYNAKTNISYWYNTNLHAERWIQIPFEQAKNIKRGSSTQCICVQKIYK